MSTEMSTENSHEKKTLKQVLKIYNLNFIKKFQILQSLLFCLCQFFIQFTVFHKVYGTT